MDCDFADDLIFLEGGGRSVVRRRGDVVIRDTGPWTPAVHALLRHLEDAGFAAAPRLAGSGLDHDGREVLTFIEGEFTQPGPWSLDGAAGLGSLLRDLHLATRSFSPPPDAVWFPWRGRDLGSPVKVIGHCDVAPWNIVARDGLPVALIDWETAGPVDPLVELAQLAWLNAKLHDDVVAEREHLPPLADRARQLAAIVDAYGLTAGSGAVSWTGSSSSPSATPRGKPTTPPSPPRRPSTRSRYGPWPGALAPRPG